MLSVIPLMTIAGVILFGNVINGTVLGLNYIGKSNESNLVEFQIKKIEHNYSTGGRRGMSRNNPEVYLKKNGELISIDLPERWDSNKKYSEYKSIEFGLTKGLFGLEIITEYELKK